MMLAQLIAKLKQGGTFDTRRLAAELQAPIELVEAMLEHLQRQGIIQDVVRCTDGCPGCSLQDRCAVGNEARVRSWHDQTGK